jgi:hypothetical protein
MIWQCAAKLPIFKKRFKEVEGSETKQELASEKSEA